MCPDGVTRAYEHFDGPFLSYWYLAYIRNAFDDCFIDVQSSDTGYVDTIYQDIISNSNDLVSYLSGYPLTTPHGFQILDCDHYHHHPASYMDLPLGLTADPDENNHMTIAFGTIMDIFGAARLDYKRIDERNVYHHIIISGISAAHEFGHAIGFHEQIDQKSVGHFSGSGIMWSLEGIPDTCPPTLDRNRMSYLWGDHIFILRLDPEI